MPSSARSMREAAGLPDHYAEQLRSALRHYGIETLDRTPALEEACYRLFLAQQRAPTVQRAVLAILDRRLEQAECCAGVASPDFRAALDGLAAATDGRDPVLADLARQVRFAYFDEPVIAAARAKVYAAADADLEALAEDPERPDRDARLASLVACPQPLAPSLVRRMADAQPAARRALLEATARRYYRMRTLGPFAETIVDGHRLFTTRYRHEGRTRHLATAFGTWPSSRPSPQPSPPGLRGFLPVSSAVADLYSRVDVATGPAGLAERVRALLAGIAMPPCVHRVVVGAAAARHRPGAVGHDAAHLPPERRRPGRGRGAARPAPDDVVPPAARPAVGVRAGPAARRGGRLSVPRRRAQRTRRTSGCSRWRRCATSRRCATPTGRSPRCPSSSGCSCWRSRRSAASRPTVSRAAGCSGTASSCTSGPRST